MVLPLVFKLGSFCLNKAKFNDIKKSLFMKDLNDILFSNLRTDVKDWSIFFTLKTDTWKTDLYLVQMKNGY